MNRRVVIKNLALVLAGSALLPSCIPGKKPAIALKNISMDADQENLVADIAETIIPKTSTPGAKDLNLHLFVLKMLDDCHTKEDQQAFVKGMAEFNDLTKKIAGKSFADCSVTERENILKSFEKKGPEVKPGPMGKKNKIQGFANGYSKELNTFYGIIKGETVNGYTNSKYFMTKQLVYELVPGRYNAWYPAKKSTSTAAKNG